MVRRIAILIVLLIPIGARGQGVLLLSDGKQVPAVDTDVKLRVRGMILRGEVTQRFRNPSEACTEAVYADESVRALQGSIAGVAINSFAGALTSLHGVVSTSPIESASIPASFEAFVSAAS